MSIAHEPWTRSGASILVIAAAGSRIAGGALEAKRAIESVTAFALSDAIE